MYGYINSPNVVLPWTLVFVMGAKLVALHNSQKQQWAILCRLAFILQQIKKFSSTYGIKSKLPPAYVSSKITLRLRCVCDVRAKDRFVTGPTCSGYFMP